MSTDFKKISNPLTIIAIFAGLAEINGTVVLGLVPESLAPGRILSRAAPNVKV